EVVINELQGQTLIGIDDRENVHERSLEPLDLPLLDRHVRLKKIAIGTALHFEQRRQVDYRVDPRKRFLLQIKPSTQTERRKQKTTTGKAAKGQPAAAPLKASRTAGQRRNGLLNLDGRALLGKLLLQLFGSLLVDVLLDR